MEKIHTLYGVRLWCSRWAALEYPQPVPRFSLESYAALSWTPFLLRLFTRIYLLLMCSQTIAVDLSIAAAPLLVCQHTQPQTDKRLSSGGCKLMR